MDKVRKIGKRKVFELVGVQQKSKDCMTQDVQKYALEKEFLEREWESITAERRAIELDKAAIEREADLYSPQTLMGMRQDLKTLERDLSVRTSRYRDRQEAHRRSGRVVEKYPPSLKKEILPKETPQEEVSTTTIKASVEVSMVETGLVGGFLFILMSFIFLLSPLLFR